ncbi:MAG: amidase [Actinomycetes bacterium]
MTALGLTAAQIAASVRTNRLTPRQVVREHLERIAAYDGLVGAFTWIRDVAAVLAEADAVAARYDLTRLPLAGVPVAVKDNLPVAGEPMRSGSTATPTGRASADHEVVRRVRDAGAVVVGLTRVPELCVFGTTDGATGVARNPWDTSRTPGGSSGGSAAAVSAGMVPVALGNDGMGSIRIPAACCGLVGLKPGRGLVPAGLGALDWYGMSENGPLTTTVDDAALLLGVLAGDPSLGRVRGPERPLRVAFSTRSPVAGVRPSRQDVAAVEGVARLMGDAGHEVVPAGPSYPVTAAAAATCRWLAGTAADAQGLDPSQLQRRTRVHAALGARLRRLGLPRDRWAASWQARAREFLSGHDVLLTPALARTPPPARDWGSQGWLANMRLNVRYAPYAAPWNLAGLPAVVVPAGRRSDGLPLAVQMVAGDGGEELLLALAALVEDRLPWPRLAATLATPPAPTPI